MHKDRRSGIYKITNLKNGKYYIGSAIHLLQRRNEHLSFLRRKKHHSIALQRAYNKYGEENFKFEILSYCPKEYLIKLEQWFLNSLKPKYNCCKKAGSVLGFKHSPETVAEIRRRNKGQVSPNKGKKYSEEFKKKLSKAHNHEKKPLYSFTPEGKFVKRYDSREDAIRNGFDAGNIRHVLIGNKKTHKGLIWKNHL